MQDQSLEYGSNRAEDIIESLFYDPDYRKNMLNEEFGEAGVAFCADPENGYRTVIVYANHFIIN